MVEEMTAERLMEIARLAKKAIHVGASAQNTWALIAVELLEEVARLRTVHLQTQNKLITTQNELVTTLADWKKQMEEQMERDKEMENMLAETSAN